MSPLASRLRVVVPSWGALSDSMRVETGVLYPAFVWVGGLPLWVHVARSYAHWPGGVELVLVLAPDAPEPDTTWMPLAAHSGAVVVQVRRLAHSACIADTVCAGLQGLAPGQAVVVHMADTLVDKPLACAQGAQAALDAVFVQQRSDLYRYTSVCVSASGQLQVLADRWRHSDEAGPADVCVGVFALANGALLLQCVEQALQADACAGPTAVQMDAFFVALQLYSRAVPVRLVQAQGWRDFGHVDAFYESRLSFHNLRHFNSLSYDADSGVVTKRSANVQAFRHQVRWFRQVPDALACFLPRIYEANDGPQPRISMELLSIPTLSDLWVSERLELGAWNDVARKLAQVLQGFGGYAFASAVAGSMAAEVYVHKTRRRLQAFLAEAAVSADGAAAADGWVQVGARRWCVRDVLDVLDVFCADQGLLSLEVLTPIHGDLCFSNVLYDTRLRQVKLIDPRGEFGVPGIYGDARYDLAKLLHSFSGAYDALVSDRFSACVQANGQLCCDVRLSPYQERVRTILLRVLLPNEGLRSQCEALQALLFLSMLPLHSDRPDRQLAMLCVGLRLFGQAFERGAVCAPAQKGV